MKLAREYVFADTLPEGIPIMVIQTDEWTKCVALSDNALHRRRQARKESQDYAVRA